jgi:ribonucleotide reductase beta subunit family protein with ferritin-like domain
VRDLIGSYVIMEGIFFYAGSAMMLALKRQNKIVRIGEQFRVHHCATSRCTLRSGVT